MEPKLDPKSRELCIVEVLGADFGPIPTKNGSETSFGMLFVLLSDVCFLDAFGMILAQFWNKMQNHAKRCKIFYDAFLYKQASKL